MTEVLPAPTTTDVGENASAENARDSLVAALDELLKRYLLLLDQYTQARQQLSSDLSSGYISLAQANFNASNRVRYGQDFYDERMQALRRVTIQDPDSKPKPTIALTADDPKPPANDSSSPKQPPTPPDTPSKDPLSASVAQLNLNAEPPATTTAIDPTSPSAASNADSNHNTTASDPPKPAPKNQPPRQDDPIRWFGILVPPALRTAQSSFVRAVEGPVPRLVGLGAELRGLEVEIGRARKAVRKSLVA